MSLAYSIIYTAENSYEHWVHKADWQFLIIPETNASQEFISIEFTNSINAVNHFSINGYGFPTIRIHPKQQFKEISFKAAFTLLKKEVNPFAFEPPKDPKEAYKKIGKLDFKVDFESFLTPTPYTLIPQKHHDIYLFDVTKSIFENLQELKHWTYLKIYFKTGVTDVNTTVDEIIEKALPGFRTSVLRHRPAQRDSLQVCFGLSSSRQWLFRGFPNACSGRILCSFCGLGRL